MAPLHFAFAFDPRFRVALAGLGVTRRTSGITLDDSGLAVRFGPWSLATTRGNIVHAELQGPHRWWRAIGPRLSLADGGLTFGTNVERTVCIEFAERVPGLDPFGALLHPNLSLSPVDCPGLLRALEGDD